MDALHPEDSIKPQGKEGDLDAHDSEDNIYTEIGEPQNDRKLLPKGSQDEALPPALPSGHPSDVSEKFGKDHSDCPSPTRNHPESSIDAGSSDVLSKRTAPEGTPPPKPPRLSVTGETSEKPHSYNVISFNKESKPVQMDSDHIKGENQEMYDKFAFQ